MKLIVPVFAAIVFLSGCNSQNSLNSSGSVIANGQMPTVAKDNSKKVHLVYGTGDSIMYSYSMDQGNTFSTPTLVSVLPELAASHTRGPQVVSTPGGLVVTACSNSGNIFSYRMDQSGNWSQPVRVNDVDTVAKENLMAMAADGDNVFAVWLDLRDRHNKIFGAGSLDGGKTWNKNHLIYASPDTTVCECCKPSVAVKGNRVNIMFRNWLQGNRDLYLVQSLDGGNSFGQAQKLGVGSWALKGCPMDGGAVVIDKNGNPQTVWNRNGTIYACEPGKEEKALGKGRSCTMESLNGKNVYAWVEKGEVVVLKPQGIKTTLGKGQLPVLKAIDNDQVLCVWEQDKQIHSRLLDL